MRGGGPGAHGGPPGGRGGPGDTVASQQVTSLFAADADRYTWVAAASGSLEAAGYQLAVGHPVMPVGGFAGGDPAPTLEQFQNYVSNGRIHYYLESSRPGMLNFGGTSDTESTRSVSDTIHDWIEKHYTAMTVDGVTLYDLTSAAH